MSDESVPKAGVKNDKGKVKFHLVPIEPLWALAKLYTIGAIKYDPWNWAKGLSWGRVYDAMIRHSGKWLNRQKFDLKDGQHHLIAVAWCAFTLYVYELFGIGIDDRATYNITQPPKANMDPALKSLYEPEEIEPESVTSLMEAGEPVPLSELQGVSDAEIEKTRKDLGLANGEKPHKKVVEAVFKEFDDVDDPDDDEEIE